MLFLTGFTTKVEMPMSKKTVKLTKEGNTFYVKVELNEKVRAKLILDTGATYMQISKKLARKLGIKEDEGFESSIRVADGRSVKGRMVNLKSIGIGRIKVYNLKAFVPDKEKIGFDGLLGMNFLGKFTIKFEPSKSKLILHKKQGKDYTDNGDGTVTDNQTGLMWQQQDDGIKRVCDDAIEYCDRLSLAGYNDWELPYKRFLLSLLESNNNLPAIDPSYFPNSKSVYMSYKYDYTGRKRALRVDFRKRKVLDSDSEITKSHVRCVRIGQ